MSYYYNKVFFLKKNNPPFDISISLINKQLLNTNYFVLKSPFNTTLSFKKNYYFFLSQNYKNNLENYINVLNSFILKYYTFFGIQEKNNEKEYKLFHFKKLKFLSKKTQVHYHLYEIYQNYDYNFLNSSYHPFNTYRNKKIVNDNFYFIKRLNVFFQNIWDRKFSYNKISYKKDFFSLKLNSKQIFFFKITNKYYTFSKSIIFLLSDLSNFYLVKS